MSRFPARFWTFLLVLGLLPVYGVGSASATASLQSGCSQLNGHWNGDYGNFYIRIEGDRFKAVYDHDNGRILGSVTKDCGHVVGWWSEDPSRRPPADAGEMEFRVQGGAGPAGALKLDGKWRYGTQGSFREDWDLVKVGDGVPRDVRDKFADSSTFIPHP